MFCFCEFIKTIREEQIINGTTNPSVHQYYVNRKVFAITPKVGFLFTSKKHFFADIGVGVGAKYIESANFDKTTTSVIAEKETITGKPFESGTAVKINVIVQLKIGYNF